MVRMSRWPRSEVAPVGRAQVGHLRDVRARDEGLGPRTGEDDHADAGIARGVVERGLQRVQRGRIEGIEFVGAIDGEATDAGVIGDQDKRFGHGFFASICKIWVNSELRPQGPV